MNNECEHEYGCRVVYTDLESLSTKEAVGNALNEFRMSMEDCRQRCEGQATGYYKSEYDKRLNAVTIKDKLETEGWWIFDYCPNCGAKISLEDL